MGEFVVAGRVDEFEEGSMEAFDVRGTKIAVAYVNGTFHAFGDTCTHRGCSLAEGDLEETTVNCPCHGSEFDVRTRMLPCPRIPRRSGGSVTRRNCGPMMFGMP